ncbi:uncharacterized protein LOC128832020 [Malaclemys terrapin pileata]|uniref:uncharacterized protein LOC128832020 n=1 Tax=Malaclemys terrapin pileata TaxID=2991368 RepID=UPI0023A80B41|nr:uncharacterized protein LOC128832020 [Malaclemys terrapin pileata]
MTVKMCVENDISIPPVKKRKTSTRIDDAFESQHHFDTKEEQERITSFYPLLDSVITGIDQRFEQETCKTMTAMGKLQSLDIGRDDMRIIANKFKVSLDELEAEVGLLQGYDGSVPKGSTTNTTREWLDWLKESDWSSMFQAFYKSIQCFAVLLVTSCSCERAFSKLAHVKNKLKSTMSQQRLDPLMLLYIEKELASSVKFLNHIIVIKSITPGERRLILKDRKMKKP